ncbi:hypothetical protein DSECCO2_329350 [anaerobic digester metagenome]
MEPQPVRLSPRASVKQAMVLAVNSPEQAPCPGQAHLSISSTSASLIFPALLAPSASKTLCRSSPFSSLRPGSIGPPVSMMVGRSRRPAAISMPGVILSQLVTPTQPSMQCACTMISTQSEMTSRDTNE